MPAFEAARLRHMSAVTDHATLPLEDLHVTRGVVVGEERGCSLPLHYGDPRAEVEAATVGCAMVDLSWADRLELRGADRARLVNGLFSADIEPLEAGCGRYGFFTDGEGRVLADAYISVLEDRLWLQLPAGRAPEMKEHIEHYRVIDDVDVTLLHDMLDVAVVGARAAEVLGEMCELPDTDRLVRTRLAGTEIQVLRRLVHGVEALVLWLPAAIAEPILEQLLARHELTLAGWAALETLRCRAGVARWGVDYDDRSVANETALLDEAVDFTKGCYLGQEIVARIFYRGKPARECRPLEIRSDAPPGAGLLTAEGKEIGKVTSVAPTTSGEVWAAVGTLSRSALDSEATAEWSLSGAPTHLRAAS
ncbi:MAG: hypothetical protein VYE73_13265 [Acidobacteriota bacterium]|nr:hypothetical protein [Acidobacteriota bacterium]